MSERQCRSATPESVKIHCEFAHSLIPSFPPSLLPSFPSSLLPPFPPSFLSIIHPLHFLSLQSLSLLHTTKVPSSSDCPNRNCALIRSLLSGMNTRSNPLPELVPPTSARQNRPAKKTSANTKNLKASSAKKPVSKKRKGPGEGSKGPGEGSKGPHPSTTGGQREKRQKQTTLTRTESFRSSSPENEVNTSIMTADTSSTYLDTEALELEEQRQRSSSHRGQFITMSPAANIVSVGIRRGAPSSVGSLSSVHPSSSASQRAVSPRISYASSPLRFELESSPLRFETRDEPHTPMNQL